MLFVSGECDFTLQGLDNSIVVFVSRKMFWRLVLRLLHVSGALLVHKTLHWGVLPCANLSDFLHDISKLVLGVFGESLGQVVV
jgi:hypothetical protein